MKIVVFGACSPIGLEITKQALFKGHAVIGYDKNIHNINFPDQGNLHLVAASLFDEEEITKVVRDSDALVFGLSPDSSEANNSRSLGVKKIIAAMAAQSLKRIIIISDASVMSSQTGVLMINEKPYKQKQVVLGIEYLQVKGLVEASKLDWTMLCTDSLFVEKPTGEFTEHLRLDFDELGTTGTGNMAMAAINSLEKNEYVKQVVLIKNSIR